MKYGASLAKLIVFMVITLFLTGLLVQTIGNISFDSERSYNAVFTDATGLFGGNDVRIAGVKVGTISGVKIVNKRQAEVSFTVKSNVKLYSTTKARIRYLNLIGGRFLALEEGVSDASATPAVLPSHGVIPISQTQPALDLTVLFNGFKPLFQALNPRDVNRLAFEIVQTLQGEGGTLNELLIRTASLTNTIADRDRVIGDVITNLNTVLGTVDARDNQLDQLIVQLQRLFGGLSQDRQAIGDSLVNIDNLASDFSSLLVDARPPLAADITRLNTVASQLASQKGALAQQLQTIPRTLNTVGRTATYGSWFNFFLCKADGQVTLGTGKGAIPVVSPSLQNADGVCNG
jgi:phospholipid/cholesterol/gamma-HCH transport system substrate-binding protein